MYHKIRRCNPLIESTSTSTSPPKDGDGVKPPPRSRKRPTKKIYGCVSKPLSLSLPLTKMIPLSREEVAARRGDFYAIFLDLEATSFHTETARIISIGAVVVEYCNDGSIDRRGRRMFKTKHRLFFHNLARPYPVQPQLKDEIVILTGIDDEQLSRAQPFYRVWEHFAQMVNIACSANLHLPRIAFAHNGFGFDFPLISRELADAARIEEDEKAMWTLTQQLNSYNNDNNNNTFNQSCRAADPANRWRDDTPAVKSLDDLQCDSYVDTLLFARDRVNRRHLSVIGHGGKPSFGLRSLYESTFNLEAEPLHNAMMDSVMLGHLVTRWFASAKHPTLLRQWLDDGYRFTRCCPTTFLIHTA